jgi:hypothetical protein
MKIKTENLNPSLLKTANLYNFIDNQKKTFVNSLRKEDGDYIQEPSTCLIKIEPVKSEEAITLYGSNVKSLIVNKITVRLAMVNKNNPDDYKEGDLILETLMTDEDLSEAIFNSNAQSYPCTNTKIMDESIAFENNSYIKKPVDIIDDSAERHEKSSFDRLDETSELIKSSLLKSKIPKKITEEILKNLNFLKYTSADNYSYSVNLLAEKFEGTLASTRVEVSSTIEKMLKYYSDSDNLVLENKKEYSDFNLLSWLMSGSYSESERRELYTIFSNISLNDILSSDKSDELYKSIKMLKDDFSNEHILSKSNSFNKRNGYFEVSKIQGTTDIFGSLRTQNHFVELRFGNSYTTNKTYGNKIFSCSNLLTLQISFENLLVLLRGNVNKDYIPCSISRLAGLPVPKIPISLLNNETEKLFSDVSIEYKSHSVKINYIYSEIEILLNNGISNKSHKSKLSELFDEYSKEFKLLSLKLKTLHKNDQKKVFDIYDKKLKKSLEKSIKLLSEQDKNKIIKLLN